MTWVVLIAIIGAVIATFVEKGMGAFLVASTYSNLAAGAKIAYDNWHPLRRMWTRARLWFLNETLEWEVRATYHAQGTDLPAAATLKDVLLKVMGDSKRKTWKERKDDWKPQGAPTKRQFALFHRALMCAFEFDVRPDSPMVSHQAGPEYVVEITINAAVGYRETDRVFSDVHNEFFLRLEQLLRPVDVKYTASVSAEKKNPFAGAFVQNLKVESIDSFSVRAVLTGTSNLVVSERRITVVSEERSDFLMNARSLLQKLA